MKNNKKYCGTVNFPDWASNILSWFHNPACKCHDEDYDSMLVRVYADLLFLLRMLRNAAITIFKGVGMLALAPLMFIFVLFFGWTRYGKK